MKEVILDLGERSYPIYIGEDLLPQCASLLGGRLGRQVMIVTNTTVAPLYLETVQAALGEHQLDSLIIDDGEQHKTLETFANIITALLNKHFDRSCTLIALGGGVVGDVTGFAAASYQRGVGYIQLPTTLLSQVDSAVGGKTAVNHALGKNMIGAFHQPRAVIADTGVLATLPEREFRAGVAEVIKYGCIKDAAFFDWLVENIKPLMQREPAALADAIQRSCINKAEVVAGDETESGLRAILNLGHTFGHAIETALDYKDWLHGEAVAAGMAMAADLSVRCGLLAATDRERIVSLLQAAELPLTLPPQITAETLRANMSIDKKVKDGNLQLILLTGIGQAIISTDFTEADLMQTITAFTDR
ncbi:MAG: 3-dehydroquinate synthase [Gammaproteobacteria bacterium]